MKKVANIATGQFCKTCIFVFFVTFTGIFIGVRRCFAQSQLENENIVGLSADELLDRVIAAAYPSENFRVSWTVTPVERSGARSPSGENRPPPYRVVTYDLTFVNGRSRFHGSERYLDDLEDDSSIVRTIELEGGFDGERYRGVRATTTGDNTGHNFQWISSVDENRSRLSRFLYIGLGIHSSSFLDQVTPTVHATGQPGVYELRLLGEDETTWHLIVDSNKGYHVEQYRRVRPDGRVLSEVQVILAQNEGSGTWYPASFTQLRYDRSNNPHVVSNAERTHFDEDVAADLSDIDLSFDSTAKTWHEDAQTWIEPTPELPPELLVPVGPEVEHVAILADPYAAETPLASTNIDLDSAIQKESHRGWRIARWVVIWGAALAAFIWMIIARTKRHAMPDES